MAETPEQAELTGREKSNANLVVGQSRNAEAALKQRANLDAYNATRHGAYSRARVEPLRDRALTDLQARFPSAPPQSLVTQAARQARIELLAAFIDDVGPIRSNGDPWPATLHLSALEVAYERRERDLEDRERQHELAARRDRLAATVVELVPTDERRAELLELLSGVLGDTNGGESS